MKQPDQTYWKASLYINPRVRPAVSGPARKLPPRAAQRFKRAREGLLGLKGMTEQVVFMGTWKWVWMFEIGGRKLAYLHPMKRGVSATFVVTESELPHFLEAELPPPASGALENGQDTELDRRCWIDLRDMSAVDALLEAVRLKYELIASPTL